MAKETIAEKLADYTKLVKLNKLSINTADMVWRTHKKADEAIETLNKTLVDIANNVIVINKEPQKEIKMTLTELVTKYNGLVKENPGIGDFTIVKSFRTKAIAQDAIEEVEEMIEAASPGQKEEEATKPLKTDTQADKAHKADKPAKTKTKENTVAKKDKKVETPEIKLNRVQWIILNLFKKKDTMEVDKLKTALAKETDPAKAKIIHAQLGVLRKKFELVTVEGEGNEKTATILPAGREAAKLPEPELAPTPEKKVYYKPLYTPEEIAGMKKKKAKKAQTAQEEHEAAFVKEHGELTKRKAPVRTESTYKGGIDKGKWQDDDFETNPNERKACQDLWEEVVTDKFLITRSEFMKLAADKYEMKASTPATLWSWMYKHYGYTAEQVKSIQDGVPADPAEKTDDKPEKSKASKKADKAAKKAKKAKKSKK